MTLRTLKRYRLERLTQPVERENSSMDHALSLADAAFFRPLSPGANVLREGPPTILAIDDSRTIQKIIEITLRRAGYEVCLFSDGLEAFSWLRGGNQPVPRLMLLDIQLPKMDGYEVARMLRAKNLLEEMPLILMSSRDGVVDRLKGRLVGAQAYLTKPFTAQQLLEIVRWSLDKRIWV